LSLGERVMGIEPTAFSLATERPARKKSKVDEIIAKIGEKVISN